MADQDKKLVLLVIFLCIIILSPSALHCKNIDKYHYIKYIRLTKQSFNPSKGEKVGISFYLSTKAKVYIYVFDFDWDLVTSLCQGKRMNKGEHTVFWNGKDDQEIIVPDEAYFFVIKALTKEGEEIYDPTTFSGGMMHRIKKLKLLSNEQQLEYFLPEKARVWIRAGIVDGPLLAIPVDGEPRDKGIHREHWNGKDQDGLLSLYEMFRYQVQAFYITFPENTVITYGNRSLSYRRYKLKKMRQFVKHTNENLPASVLISPMYRVGIFFAKSIPVDLFLRHIPVQNNNSPQNKRNIKIMIDYKKEWKRIYSKQRVEVYIFVDGRYVSEEGWLTLPCETVVDISNIKRGEHVVTVNVIGLQGQIGIRSKKFDTR